MTYFEVIGFKDKTYRKNYCGMAYARSRAFKLRKSGYSNIIVRRVTMSEDGVTTGETLMRL